MNPPTTQPACEAAWDRMLDGLTREQRANLTNIDKKLFLLGYASAQIDEMQARIEENKRKILP